MEQVPPLGPDTFAYSVEPQPVERQRSPIGTGIIAFLAAVVWSLVTIGILTFAGFFSTAEDVAEPLPTTTTAAPVIIQQEPLDIENVRLAEAVWVKVNPSIVTVEVGDLSDGELTLTGSGSGVVLEDGYIATNHHVIEGTDAARVVLQNGRVYDAVVVGSDAYTDLAVLSVDADGLVPIEIGSADELAIGQVTIALGNPLGQSGGASLTVGVLSALSRRVDFEDNSTLFGMLQTDAPITSGSSGGALVDEEGRLIGITSAIGLSDAGAEGIGYAIPVDLVQRVTSEIIATGEVRHSYLGIVGGDYTATGEDGATVPAGAIVDSVEEAGPADLAGLEQDDVIVAIAGIDVTTMQELIIQLRLHRVGETVRLDILRDGDPQTVTVTLGARPDDV